MKAQPAHNTYKSSVYRQGALALGHMTVGLYVYADVRTFLKESKNLRLTAEMGYRYKNVYKLYSYGNVHTR